MPDREPEKRGTDEQLCGLGFDAIPPDGPALHCRPRPPAPRIAQDLESFTWANLPPDNTTTALVRGHRFNFERVNRFGCPSLSELSRGLIDDRFRYGLHVLSALPGPALARRWVGSLGSLATGPPRRFDREEVVFSSPDARDLPDRGFEHSQFGVGVPLVNRGVGMSGELHSDILGHA
jgi:hypothetical protein